MFLDSNNKKASKFFLVMAQRVYTILSRTAVAGQQVVPYDQGELDFTETGPVWYLATLDQETFHVQDFDDTLSQWVRSGVTHAYFYFFWGGGLATKLKRNCAFKKFQRPHTDFSRGGGSPPLAAVTGRVRCVSL